MEVVETCLTLLEDDFVTDLPDCTVGRFTVVFLTDEPLLPLVEELLLVAVFLGLLLTSFFITVLVFPVCLDTTALLFVIEFPLPLLLLVAVVLLTDLCTLPLSLERTVVLLETELLVLVLGELLLTVVLRFMVLFPLVLLRCVVFLDTVLLFLAIVLLETVLLFLNPSLLVATDLLDLRLLLVLYPLSLTATLLSFL